MIETRLLKFPFKELHYRWTAWMFCMVILAATYSLCSTWANLDYVVQARNWLLVAIFPGSMVLTARLYYWLWRSPTTDIKAHLCDKGITFKTPDHNITVIPWNLIKTNANGSTIFYTPESISWHFTPRMFETLEDFHVARRMIQANAGKEPTTTDEAGQSLP
jgi:hypothetical protein